MSPSPSDRADSSRLDRREAIQWMLAASATVAMLHDQVFGAESAPAGASAAARGYGTDPNLVKAWKPGAVWPLTFSAERRRTVAALCDVILPADERSPAASAVGVPDFIDEWISAPYPLQQADRQPILDGLAWLDTEARKRFEKPFAELTDGPRRAICDEICHLPRAKAEFKAAADFFARFRNLAASGFYTTPAGWKDLQYAGNRPLAGAWPGPPREVLAHLKLT